MWKNTLKIAIRSLGTNRLFTSINIIGLTIGLATSLLIFLWVSNELTFDQHHKAGDRIYRVLSNLDVTDDIWHWSTLPYPAMELIKAKIPEVEKMAAVARAQPIFRVGREVFQQKMVYVNEHWFDQFEYDVLHGSSEAFYANPYSLALTERRAEQLFGTTNVLGEVIQMDTIALEVTMVLDDPPSNSSFQFDVYAPIGSLWSEAKREKKSNDWGNFDYNLFLRLYPGADPMMVGEKITSILDENRDDNSVECELQALADVRFSQQVDHDFIKHQNKAAVYIFSLIGFILLLTAALNYVNLSTALVGKRIKEIGVKKIIGASFNHIFFQMILETFVMSFMAFVLAIGIAEIFLPWLSGYTEIPLDLDFTNTHLWMVFGGLMLLNVLIAGVYPAVLFAGFKPVRLLRGKNLTREGVSMRHYFVVAQFVLTFIVLIGTIIIHQQLHYINSKEVGYDRSYVIDFKPNLFRGDWSKNAENFALFAKKIEEYPAFTGVAATGGPIVNIASSNGGDFKWDGMKEGLEVTVNTFSADEKFLDVFAMQMAAGRWFTGDSKQDYHNIIINETAAKKFNLQQPVVGKKISFRGDDGVIVGVAKDFHFSSMHHEIKPLLISHNQGRGYRMSARVNGAQAQMALSQAKAEFVALFPDIPFEYEFLDDTFEKMHQTEVKLSSLFKFFAGILIFISCLGLFGLATFAVERRTKEIGIRKVLGASTRLIVQLLSKDFLKLVVIALLIASPIAWYLMGLWLEGYAYRISIQWWVFLLAGVVAISIAFFTVSFQSIRAALANPVESLRNE